uniref:Carbohydrate sulfotransferase n=1 Tax=Branchiostoma floridae TaxID=7739 RepID=C3Y6X3_BRAFL|eukprot:XP_002608073.1 hypothetical protein BRAFLDRAFT_91449 [Branchiostoma floridae]
MYCFIPKTGCTTTKYLMYNLQHGTNASAADPKQTRVRIHQEHYSLLKDYSKEEADIRLATYNKLIVVRDPLERLASAWLDKFVHNPDRFSYIKTFRRKTREKNLREIDTKQGQIRDPRPFPNIETFWKQKNREEILRRNDMRQARNLDWIKRGSVRSDGKPPVPFRDFIQSITNKVYINIHWEPFFSLCAPCQVEYDFIAHTDTLAEDLRVFLHKIGVIGKDYLLPTQHPSRAKTSFGTTFREVPTEDLRRIGEIYKPDFDMFGYNFEEDLALIENLRGTR